MAGLLGHGDAFVLRDPNGIRPAYYYVDDEVAVVTSERPAAATAFNVSVDEIKPIPPGHAFIIRSNGDWEIVSILEPRKLTQCSFERIYFSRGSDYAIYNERKKLGELVVPAILDSVDHDLEHTVFSYIPNTAETAFYGMIKGVETYLNQKKTREIMAMNGNYDPKKLKLCSIFVRA